MSGPSPSEQATGSALRSGCEAVSDALPPVWQALIPVAFLVAALAVSIRTLGISAHIPLVLATAVAAVVGRLRGLRWPALRAGMVGGIQVAIPACLILMVIGILIGVWVRAGIVPTLIVYGLKTISPAYFLVTSCVVSSVVSLSTGSSWSTAGTVGVALVGIGAALGVHPGMTAGAIVSGAYFGDKMSPLSDTTNLAPAVAGSELFEHVRHMVYTTLPALLLALLAYLFLGLGGAHGGGGAAGDVDRLLGALSRRFEIRGVLLLPLLAVVGMVAAKVPALPALLLGALLGGVFAWATQGASVWSVLDAAQNGYHRHQLGPGFAEAVRAGLAAPEVSAVVGLSAERISQARVDALVRGLLERGGLQNMMSTVALILCALSFGGVMERAGLLASLARAILWGARSTGSLVARTLITCITMNALVADQYMAIVIPGRMYRDAYRERGLHPKNLSRALEDSGTMTSCLFPWNSGGAYMATTLGVATWSYAPFAFVNLLSPVVSALYGYTGWTLAPGSETPAGQKPPDAFRERDGAEPSPATGASPDAPQE